MNNNKPYFFKRNEPALLTTSNISKSIIKQGHKQDNNDIPSKRVRIAAKPPIFRGRSEEH